MRELAIGICQLPPRSAETTTTPARRISSPGARGDRDHGGAGAKLIVFGEIFLNGYETNELTPT